MLIHSAEITGSVQFNDIDVSAITNVAGFATTASVDALVVKTGSYASTSSVNELQSKTGSYTTTSSFGAYSSSINTFTSSTATRLSTIESVTGSYATTGSNQFNGNQSISGSITSNGTITAQTLVVQTVTSSVEFVTGSTKNGSLAANTHQFTGSVFISGSVGIGRIAPTTPLHVTGDVTYQITGSSALTVNHLANDTSDRTIYIWHGLKSQNGTNFGYQTYIDQGYYYNYFQHPPLANYANRQGSSTYIFSYETGYDNALLARSIFQVNGYDKLTILENGTIVIGTDNNSVNNTYPSILRATNAYTFSSDSPGKDIYLQGGAGRGTGAGGSIIFQTAGAGSSGSTLNSHTTRMTITSTGVVQPGANGTQDLGTSSLRWATIYTSDLSLSNGIGDYTIVEGENDLFLYNNKQNKVYKFVLAEVDPADATPKKS